MFIVTGKCELNLANDTITAADNAGRRPEPPAMHDQMDICARRKARDGSNVAPGHHAWANNEMAWSHGVAADRIGDVRLIGARDDGKRLRVSACDQ